MASFATIWSIMESGFSNGSSSKEESKHFTSLQIFTSHAEPALDEYLARKDQQDLEQKHRDEEDKLYRKFLSRRREEEDNVTQMGEEEREVYVNQLTAEERSKVIKLTEKHSRQMMDMIYKKKMAYFQTGGDDWKEVLGRSYPRDPPPVEPPPYNKEMVYENNHHVFEAVDDDAIKVSEENYRTYTALVRGLVGKCTSDIEKARALFRYLTEKKLNHQSWFLYYPEEGNKRGAPTQLLRGVEFGIETKALLFKRLCSYAGLHCEVVKGYSKSTDYLPGEEFVDTRYRNTWNAVYAAGGWRLIQCNWAMLNLHSKAERETRKFYQDHYFLTDPDKFIFEFFPINAEWQLMEQAISIQEFEDLPLLRSTFFHFGLGLDGNSASILDTTTDGSGELKVQLLNPPHVGFHYELSFFKSGNTSVDTPSEGKVPMARFLMMSTENDTTTFHFLAPQKGTYLLDIFAANYPNYEGCQKKEATKYINVCRFRINCAGVDKVNVPLPNCAPGEWGPTKAVKLIGLLPTSHFYPVINAAPDANVDLSKEKKPLTLNMEFEMTKPMLDFLIRLHKNGDNPYDDQAAEKSKKRDARYRIKENYLMVDVKVPQDGQYGLDIFAREKWEDQMVHCCKYLINCDV